MIGRRIRVNPRIALLVDFDSPWRGAFRVTEGRRSGAARGDREGPEGRTTSVWTSGRNYNRDDPGRGIEAQAVEVEGLSVFRNDVDRAVQGEGSTPAFEFEGHDFRFFSIHARRGRERQGKRDGPKRGGDCLTQ